MTSETTEETDFNRQFEQILGLSNTAAGQNRLVYSPAWLAAQAALIHFGHTLGLVVTVDDYGNVYLDLPGHDQQVIATGSHMDTVVNGGRFDGLYGILGGLQALRTLSQQLGKPQHTLRLIAFSEEEGSRFPTTFSGSKYYAHHQTVSSLTDATGIEFNQARLNAVSQLLTLSGVQHRRPQLPATFTELHIEQGPQLAMSHTQIGLVSAIVGQRRWTLHVQGMANHAGTTPMTQRHDALLAAVELIRQLADLAQQLNPTLTFTVGQLDVSPNSSNVVPGTVVFTVDVRHPDAAILDHFETALQETLQRPTDPFITCSAQRWVADPPVTLDQNLLQQNRYLARQLNLSTHEMISGAGHDSYVMSQVVPTTMIFVPSVNGISHSPAELTTRADLAAGISLLTASLRAQAYC